MSIKRKTVRAICGAARLVWATAEYYMGISRDWLLDHGGSRTKVSPRWLPWILTRRVVLIARLIRKKSPERLSTSGKFDIISEGTLRIAWPRAASLDLLRSIRDQDSISHPHNYFWAGTKQVSSGATVIDIGSCEGLFALRCRQMGLRVVAIEPSQTMIEACTLTFRENRVELPILHNIFLSRVDGVMYVEEDHENPLGTHISELPSRSSRPVPCLTLDTLVRQDNIEHIDFIKCDAEGAELEILKGAEKSIRAFMPKLAFCAYHNESDAANITHYINSLNIGYTVRPKGLVVHQRRLRVAMVHAWVEGPQSHREK